MGKGKGEKKGIFFFFDRNASPLRVPSNTDLVVFAPHQPPVDERHLMEGRRKEARERVKARFLAGRKGEREVRPYASLQGGAVGGAFNGGRRWGTSRHSPGETACLGLGRHFRVSGERILAEK
jgi:hypothetical protein